MAEIEIRPVPRNNEAEQALLGAILALNDAYHRVSFFLKPEHFADGVHGRIYAAIGKLIEQGQIANPVTLKHVFDHDGALTEIGGATYLARLAAAVVTIVNAEDYGRTIHACWEGRKLLALSDMIAERAQTLGLGTPPAELRAAIQEELAELDEDTPELAGLQPLRSFLTPAIEAAELAYKRGGRVQGITTGIAKVDDLIGGMRRREMTLMGGRPGMGKTTSGKTSVYAAARRGSGAEPEHGDVIAVFTLEMSGEQLAQWLLADPSGISAARMRRGDLSAIDISDLMIHADAMQDLPIFIDERRGLTAAQIVMAVIALNRKLRRIGRQVDLVVIDHIGLMEGADGEGVNRTTQITKLSLALRNAAGKLNFALLVLCQLSREVEKREDKRPMLSDLRDSGSLEQDADNVIFLYRAHYYLKQAQPVQKIGENTEKFLERTRLWQDALDRAEGLVEYIVAKQRNGPTGTVKARFEPIRSRNADLEEYTADDYDRGTLL